MKREIFDSIQDMLEAMDNAVKFLESISFEEFTQDTKTIYATIRAA